MSDWVRFLHEFGCFLAEMPATEALRPSGIVSLPCLDYSSAILASGAIVSRFRDENPVPATPEMWQHTLGKGVCFPRIKDVPDGEIELRLSEGVAASIDEFPPGNFRLLVKWVENRGRNSFTQSCAVPNHLLPLVSLLDNGPDITRARPGSVLARRARGLEAVLGAAGICKLVGASHPLVCLLDTKKRLMEEVKTRLPVSRFGLVEAATDLVLRDLVRLDAEGGEAMADTYCCKICSEPAPGFPITIFSGSLRFIRSWDECASPIRVALISPADTNYAEAIRFANDLYQQRAETDFTLPDGILKMKPSSIDVQSMYL